MNRFESTLEQHSEFRRTQQTAKSRFRFDWSTS